MARAVIEGGNAIIPSTHRDFELVQQAHKDLLEIGYIWHILRPTPDNKSLWKRFQKVFGDHPLPSHSRITCDARAAQFELLCETMLTRAGLTPIHQPGGVDFSCRLGNTEFVVEAKTARGVRAIEREVKKASDQIEKASVPGFILLDYTFAVNVDNTEHVAVYELPVRDMRLAQRARFKFIHSRFLQKLEARAVERGVIGIQFVDRLVIQNGLDRSSEAGRWQLAVFRDDRVLSSRFDSEIRLARTVFGLLAYLGLPVPPESH